MCPTAPPVGLPTAPPPGAPARSAGRASAARGATSRPDRGRCRSTATPHRPSGRAGGSARRPGARRVLWGGRHQVALARWPTAQAFSLNVLACGAGAEGCGALGAAVRPAFRDGGHEVGRLEAVWENSRLIRLSLHRLHLPVLGARPLDWGALTRANPLRSSEARQDGWQAASHAGHRAG